MSQSDTAGTPAQMADQVAAAVLAVPGVAGLHTGAFGEVATYLPGRRVDGVRVRADRCEVHLVLSWGSPVLATADRVRAAVAPLVGTVVDVSVEDVVIDTEPTPAPPAATRPRSPH